jgi:hypothetical protein
MKLKFLKKSLKFRQGIKSFMVDKIDNNRLDYNRLIRQNTELGSVVSLL